MTRGLTLLFAVAGGAAVGNLYYAQPLLETIARDLGSSTAAAGWLVTVTQLGYALGILLIVPLGDVVDRRRLVPAVLVTAATALVGCALAPSMTVLLVTVTLLGLTTVAGQLLTPLAGDLADDARRGQVVGTVVAGLLTGILVSRTIAGLVADVTGWRSVYAASAAVDVLLAVVIFRALPPLPAKTQVRYPSLIASVGRVIVRERTLRWTLVLGATGFGCFTMFWTALTFLLSAPPFSYPVSTIGLFGLVGLAGVLIAQRVGRLHDRGWSLPATGLAWVGVVLSFTLALVGEHSVLLVIAAILLLDVAIQTTNILSQTRALAISETERSRLNTAFVTSNFIGGSIGSALATVLWNAGGWRAVMLAGIGASAFALAVWAVGRRGPLVAAESPA